MKCWTKETLEGRIECKKKDTKYKIKGDKAKKEKRKRKKAYKEFNNISKKKN